MTGDRDEPFSTSRVCAAALSTRGQPVKLTRSYRFSGMVT
jgi:hypothetical protein